MRMFTSLFKKEKKKPSRIAQSVGHLTRKSGVLGSIPVLATYFRFSFPSAFSRRAVVSYWRKYVHEVLLNRLGGLSLSRKSLVRLTDRPDMTLDVYRGGKTTIQQQQQKKTMPRSAFGTRRHYTFRAGLFFQGSSPSSSLRPKSKSSSLHISFLYHLHIVMI